MNHNFLRAERIRRSWSQARVAEALGVSTKTVCRWERGLAVPYPYYRRQLAVLFGKTIQQLGLPKEVDEEAVQTERLEEMVCESLSALTPTSLLADPSISRVLGSVTTLQEHKSLVRQVKKHLFAGDNVAFVALDGLPSISKTALAMAVVTDRQVQAHFADGILWVALGQCPHMQGQFAQWEDKLLGIPPSQVENLKSRQAWNQALWAAIGTRHILLVIDDASIVEDTLAFQINSNQCTYLLTIPPVSGAPSLLTSR